MYLLRPDRLTTIRVEAVQFPAATILFWSRYDLAIIELLGDDLYHGDTSQLDLFDFDDSIPF